MIVSIAILATCTFCLGLAVGIYVMLRREEKKKEAYYRECELDWYRSAAGEPYLKDDPGF